MSNLNRNPFSIRLKQGLAANINLAATRLAALLGEPHYTTDTNRLYIFDGSRNRRVHGLDMIVCADGAVVVNDGQVVWSGEFE